MIDADYILSLNPCPEWTPERVRAALPRPLPLLDVLQIPSVSAEDKLWVVLRSDLISDRVLRLFACDCAERALRRERDAERISDARSWQVIAVARRYAEGQATARELASAATAATDAAAYTATNTAAWTAVATATANAGAAAWATATANAGADERNWQPEHLIELLQEDTTPCR